MDLAVICLRTSPIAMGLTSALGLGRATKQADDSNVEIDFGFSSDAMQEHTVCRYQTIAAPDTRTRKCSYRQPEGPQPEPLGDFCMLCRKSCMERDMFSLFKIASGRADDLFGCLLVNFSAVSSVAGANPELVRIRDALDSSPHLIHFTAALLI